MQKAITTRNLQTAPTRPALRSQLVLASLNHSTVTLFHVTGSLWCAVSGGSRVFSERRGGSRYAYVEVRARSVGRWVVAAHGVRKILDQHPSASNCQRYRNPQYSKLRQRGEMQERLGVPFRSALRVHGSDRLRRVWHMRRAGRERMLRSGWALRVRRPTR